MQRLLCIVSSLDTGGAETFLMKVYRTLDRSKYQIDFIVSADGYYDNEVSSLGGILYKIPLRSEHPIKVYKAIKKIVKQNKYEIVLKLGNRPMSVVDLIAAKRGGAKVLAMRSCNALVNLSFKQRLIDRIFRPILNRVANVKLAPSDLAAIYTFGNKKYQNREVAIIHNGVDINLFKYDEIARKKIREELGVGDNLLVGHIGRFSRQKNHKFILPVFAKVKEINPKAKLLLVGTGELIDKVKSQAEDLAIIDDVIFAGIRSDVPALLSAMDVFVLPSLYEGMPNTVIEAQATGLGCVITDVITRQANIIDKVAYLPLNENYEEWAREVIKMVGIMRKDATLDFINAGYDIESVKETFVKTIFEKATGEKSHEKNM